MSKCGRFVVLHIAVGIALLLVGLLGLDRVVAEFLHGSGFEGQWIFSQGTSLLDVMTGKDVSKFFIGLVLAGCAIALLATARSRAVGFRILFVALVQLLCTLLTGVSKNLFGRLRPFQLLENADWSHAWFADGSAFPSGHAGFYFGLFMPMAYLFPRWRWPLMLTPWFIAIARVNANDHFVSDVAASIVLAGILTLAFAKLTTQWKGTTDALKPMPTRGMT